MSAIMRNTGSSLHCKAFLPMRFCTHGHFALYLRLQTRLMCVRIARKGEEICSRSGALRQAPAAECIWETSFQPCSRGCPSEAAAEGSCCASRTWTPTGAGRRMRTRSSVTSSGSGSRGIRSRPRRACGERPTGRCFPGWKSGGLFTRATARAPSFTPLPRPMRQTEPCSTPGRAGI